MRRFVFLGGRPSRYPITDCHRGEVHRRTWQHGDEKSTSALTDVLNTAVKVYINDSFCSKLHVFFSLVRQITRKVIHKYVSADGTETQEVTIEGSQQETVKIEEGDTVSRVIKRTVLHSEGDHREVSMKP